MQTNLPDRRTTHLTTPSSFPAEVLDEAMRMVWLFSFFSWLPTPSPVLAQEETPVPLTVFISFPGRIAGVGEFVTFPLKIRSATSGIITLEIQGLPEGCSASFRSGSNIVDAVYVDGVNDTSVDVRTEPAADASAGKFTLTVWNLLYPSGRISGPYLMPFR